MIKEFRDFINRGNVVELGVAFVMGASFKSLVDVFTKRLVEPLIGLIINLPSLDKLGTVSYTHLTLPTSVLV